MIAKITSGARFTGLARYLHGPGRDEEHVYAGRAGGAVIAGNLAFEGARDGGEWAGLLREAAGTRPEIERPVWHVSLRNPASDRTLSDAQWADAGQGFAQAMGFEEHPWVMVRHGEDHVHLVLSRVGFDGRVWSKGNDRYKAQAATAALEGELGLSAAPRRSVSSSRREADHQVSAGEWRRGLREQVAPGRVVLASSVVHAAVASVGGGRAAFEVALERAGVEHQINIASTGRVSGYRFHLPGHDDAAGEAVWFRASQLDKRLAWSRLSPILEGPAPVAPPHLAPVKKRLETKRHHRGRAEREEATARLSRMPAAIKRSGYDHDAWWRQRAAAREGEIAARALARQRQGAEARRMAAFRATFNPPGPALSPKAQATLRASIEQDERNTTVRRTRSPGPERGSSFER